VPPDPEDIFISRREWEVYLEGHDLRHQEALAWRQRLAESLEGYLSRGEFERILSSWVDEREQARAMRVEREQAHAAVHLKHAELHERHIAANTERVNTAHLEHEKLHQAHSLAHDEQHAARLLYDASIDSGNKTAIERAETTLREQTLLQASAHAREHELQQRATDAMSALRQKAVEEVKETNAARFEALNEARGRANDERLAYATRIQVDDKFDAQAARIDAIERQFATMSGRDRGINLAWTVALGAIGLLVMLLGFFAVKGGA